MRIGLFSDIHSNYHALEAVLADMQNRGVDRLVCLGDLTLKGPLPKECVDRVRTLGCPVVLGNTDAAYDPELHPSQFPVRNHSQEVALADFDRHLAALTPADQAWLRALPLNYSDTVEGNRLDFFHAVPHHNYVLVMPWATNAELEGQRLSNETRASAFGHCHRPFMRTVAGRMVINTGSVGIPFDGDPRPSYVVLDVQPGALAVEIRRVEYDAEAAIRTAVSLGMKGWELFAHTARTGLFPG